MTIPLCHHRCRSVWKQAQRLWWIIGIMLMPMISAATTPPSKPLSLVQWQTLADPLVDELIATTTNIGEDQTLVIAQVSTTGTTEKDRSRLEYILYHQLDKQTIYHVLPATHVLKTPHSEEFEAAALKPIQRLAQTMHADFVLLTFATCEPVATCQLAMRLMDVATESIVWRFDSAQIAED